MTDWSPSRDGRHALDVLADALQWLLTEARWVAVRTAVAGLAKTLGTGDGEGVRAAISTSWSRWAGAGHPHRA